MAKHMSELARTIPGYDSHKGFAAEDGERVTIVEFESEEALQEWRHHPEHAKAKRRGIQSFSAATNSRYAPSFGIANGLARAVLQNHRLSLICRLRCMMDRRIVAPQRMNSESSSVVARYFGHLSEARLSQANHFGIHRDP